MLQLFQGCHFIRQLVDQIEDPESIVLEYMDDNVFNLLKQKQLSKVEAKRALRATMEALVVSHDENIVHTGTQGFLTVRFPRMTDLSPQTLNPIISS